MVEAAAELEPVLDLLDRERVEPDHVHDPGGGAAVD